MLIEFVDTISKLQNVIGELKKTSYIAVDTESDSLYHYEEKLCLLQIESNGTVYIIDAIQVDIGKICEIFENERIEKIFHSASSDIALIKKYLNCDIKNIFDTMVASKYIFKKAYSLKDLVKKYLGYDMSKKYQKIDWSIRPLAYKFLKYAAYDVYYLKEVRDKLYTELERKGVYVQFKNYCQNINNIRPRKREFRLQKYLSIANNYALDDNEKRLFIELVKKREEIAKLNDIPPFKVISNERLISLIKNKDMSCVPEWIRMIFSNFRYFEDKDEREFLKESTDKSYKNRIRIVKYWRRKKSEEEDILQELILTNNEIKMIAKYQKIDKKILINCGIDEERIKKYADELTSYYNENSDP